MDPGELIKVAPALQTIVTTIVAGVPIGEIVKAIVVPPAAVLGKRMADRVEQLFDKTGKMVTDADIKPQPVPDKLLIEILRNASLEEDEDLHTMWAALLANAASSENAGKVRPGFIAILKATAPDESVLLKAVEGLPDAPPLRAPTKPALDRAIAAQNVLTLMILRESIAIIDGEEEWASEQRFQTCVQVLESKGLIIVGHDDSVTLSALGRTFVEACRPPKPKS